MPMEPHKHATDGKKGQHFTWEERVKMETLVRARWPRGKRANLSELARLMAPRSRSSVSREYRRGLVTNRDTDLREYPVYSAQKAHQEATARNARKGPRMKLANAAAARLAAIITTLHYSPYAALQVMIREGGFPGLPCLRTIYYAIHAGHLEVVRAALPQGIRLKKRPYPQRMAYTARPAGHSITDRPAAADARLPGHWEMDTVVGGRGTSAHCLPVLTARHSRRQLIRRLPGRTQRHVLRALGALERAGHLSGVQTITCDNGCEFPGLASLQRSCLAEGRERFTLYYAHPYSSWERGSNENANRLIRRLIPKGADIGDYTPAQIQAIENWINAYPRKLLGGLCANDFHAA